MYNEKFVSVIIAAAGSGKRMNAGKNKQFLDVGNSVIINLTLEKFLFCDIVDEVILVGKKEELEYLRDIAISFNHNKTVKIVEGGDQRQDSIYNGLQKLDEASEIVLVHDGARPLASSLLIRRVISGVVQYDSAIPGVLVRDTIKKVNEESKVFSTPKRNNLYSIQTPQGFKKAIILEAYENAKESGFKGTDDSSLVENIGYEVHVVKGDYKNIKITTKEDLVFASVFKDILEEEEANENRHRV
jgi:2-C-methyl-D-erythritol 4-phosphate cytidylyltransferase